MTDLLVSAERVAELQARARDWPSHSLSEVQLADLELLLNGAFAPLTGYLDATDHASVCRSSQLADGTPWPVPITLDVPASTADEATAAGHLALRDPEGVLLAVLKVAARFAPDRRDEATALFGSADADDPGIDRLLRHTHDDRLAGPVEGVEAPTHWDFADRRLAPGATRAALAAAAAESVVGFAADVPPRPADLEALIQAAGTEGHLLIAALVGPDPRGPSDPYTLVRTWVAVQPRLPDPTTFGVVPLARRGTPARDAALAEIVLRNHGATQVVARPSTAPDGESFPEVEAELRRSTPPLDQRGLTVFMTGFSGSGKSTVAQALAARLRERGGRSVALLDGDLVRHHLSSELGFSRRDRDLNIRRIGFVAAEITRAGGIAICAPIAPYDGVRRDVRAMVREAGTFVLVHISTPLEVCEARDRKGLYAKARAGVIAEFTGISDPYEVPDDADLRIDTTDLTVDQAVDLVIDYLEDTGSLRRT